ncbi:unnamed protein product [Prunus armeniaca]
MLTRKIHATNNQMPNTSFCTLLIPAWCHILVIPFSRRGDVHLHSIKMETTHQRLAPWEPIKEANAPTSRRTKEHKKKKKSHTQFTKNNPKRQLEKTERDGAKNE